MFAFSSHITSAAEGLSIEAFVKEIRPVVTEKIVFLSNDASKIATQFGIFGPSKF